MHTKFKRNIGSLEEIYRCIIAFIKQNDLDDAMLFTINLVIEELFVNMVKYNPDSSSDILIDLIKENKKIVITLIDTNAEPFDITQFKTYDHTQSLEERPIGGVGIHLINKMMDKVDYEYKDGNSIITLTKYLEDKHV